MEYDNVPARKAARMLIEAARKAGYKNPHQAAYKLVRIPAIKRFLREPVIQ